MTKNLKFWTKKTTISCHKLISIHKDSLIFATKFDFSENKGCLCVSGPTKDFFIK